MSHQIQDRLGWTGTITLIAVSVAGALCQLPVELRADAPANAPGDQSAFEVTEVGPSKLRLNENLKAVVSEELGDDPAEWTHFRVALERASERFDQRNEDELVQAMKAGKTPIAREQAIVEYADRLGDKCVPVLREVLDHESSSRVRIDTLWAIAKFGGRGANDVVKHALEDQNIEVREWARIFHDEMGLGQIGFEPRRLSRNPDGVFDQSIPLHIICNLYVKTPTANWVKLVLSPLKIEEVFGKCHANPCVATREHQLILTKRLAGFYPNGGDHFEVFRFKGLTERTDPLTANFAFIAHEQRPFFVAGQIGDTSKGVLDGDVNFVRTGQWKLDSDIRIDSDYAIRYVKGNFFSWGYVAYDQIMDDDNGDGDRLDAGEMMRAVTVDDKRQFCNTFVSGTWKGKITDEDGDGVLDLNLPRPICTVDGWLDLNGDRVADEPRVTTTAYAAIPQFRPDTQAKAEDTAHHLNVPEGKSLLTQKNPNP